MGKQTAVALTPDDERAFLAFLESTGDIKLFVTFAPTIEALWVGSFEEAPGWSVSICNLAFAWTPEYGTVTADATGTHNGYRYVSNAGTAPVIEYSRHNFQNDGRTYGRIYWGKRFSDNPTYDVQAFVKWYSTVARWLRKNGRQAVKGSFNTYYLPDAWAKHGQGLQPTEP